MTENIIGINLTNKMKLVRCILFHVYDLVLLYN